MHYTIHVHFLEKHTLEIIKFASIFPMLRKTFGFRCCKRYHIGMESFVCGGTLMENHPPLTVSVICPLGAVSQQFHVRPDHCMVHDVLLSVF